MKFTTALASAAALAATSSLVVAHGPETREEVQRYYDLQASAYHCAPAVAAYTAQRKRNWAQKVLGGEPLAHKNLFVDGYFDDMNLGAGGEAGEPGKRLMACDPVQETKIRNSTCVLCGYPTRCVAVAPPGALWSISLMAADQLPSARLQPPKSPRDPTTTPRDTPSAPTWPSGNSVCFS